MSIFVANGFDIFMSFLVGLLALLFGAAISRRLGISAINGVGLTALGLFFAYIRYSVTIGSEWSDSHFYYISSTKDNLSLGFGSDLVFLVTRIFTSMGLGFMPTMFIFSVMSSVALVFLYSAYRKASRGQNQPLVTILFLAVTVPSVGLWGGAIGKDAFAVLGTALFCWALCRRNIKIWPIVLGVFLMMIVRPHIGILMLAAISAATIAAKDLGAQLRLPLLVAAGFAIFIVLPSLLLYVGVDADFLTQDVFEIVESSGDRFGETGSFIPIVDMPIPLRLFSYVFRPLPFEAASLVQLVGAAQNTIILILFLYFVTRNSLAGAWSRNFGGVAMLLFVMAAWILLANVTPNLGIAARQKQMFVPALVLALVYFSARKSMMNGRAFVAGSRSPNSAGNSGIRQGQP